tara:strand:- start:17986 stop:18129 length:144 start_codon:yes stop_codon:yes gene_type:complete
MKKIISDGQKINSNLYHAAIERQSAFQNEVNEIMKDYDCCITVSTAS